MNIYNCVIFAFSNSLKWCIYSLAEPRVVQQRLDLNRLIGLARIVITKRQVYLIWSFVLIQTLWIKLNYWMLLISTVYDFFKKNRWSWPLLDLNKSFKWRAMYQSTGWETRFQHSNSKPLNIIITIKFVQTNGIWNGIWNA